LIYSTHSHYMVEPRWLEQAYIVYDKSGNPDANVIDESIRSDSNVDINVVSYREFVATRPEQTSYFQPILDTLTVRPSRFDYKVGGLIVEGKCDFYAIQLAARVSSVDVGAVFPAHGSGTMGALVSLHRGWGLKVRVLFDADKGGRDGRKKLRADLALQEDESTTLADLNLNLSRIEDVFSENDRKALIGVNSRSSKTLIMRRVQEALASNEELKLTKETVGRMTHLCKALVGFTKTK